LKLELSPFEEAVIGRLLPAVIGLIEEVALKGRLSGVKLLNFPLRGLILRGLSFGN
jgi:hypothetical protein